MDRFYDLSEVTVFLKGLGVKVANTLRLNRKHFPGCIKTASYGPKKEMELLL
jgi:hypothetical protein